MEAFNRNFKTIREELGLTAEQMSASLEGVSVGVIRNIESGRTKKIDVTAYKKLYELSGFTKEELHTTEITAGAVRNRANRNKPDYDNQEVVLNINDRDFMMAALKAIATVEALLPALFPVMAKVLNKGEAEIEKALCDERDEYLKSLVE